MWTRRKKVFHTKPCRPDEIVVLNHAQQKVDGFDGSAYQSAHVGIIGGGGLGGLILPAIVQKGAGTVSGFDDDEVELGNLSRQNFLKSDIGRNKAIALAKHASRKGLFPTKIIAYPFRIQEVVEQGTDLSDIGALVCAVDNDITRVFVSKLARDLGIPVIFVAVSRDANQLYVAIQETGDSTCIACMVPHVANNKTYPCDMPGILDVLQIAAGYTVFALDTVLCGRYRAWNLREAFLDGSLPDRIKQIERNPNCPLCGDQKPNPTETEH